MLNQIHSLISGVFIFSGAFFMLVAALGVYRLPDLYLRMAATSKAATLGAALMIVGMAIYFLDVGVIARAIATVTFLFLTAPIAAHALGRAAYVSGVRPDSRTRDQMKGRYQHPRTREHANQIQNPPPNSASNKRKFWL
jgi:multicomponent Na+:H+ antiporter subunit G